VINHIYIILVFIKILSLRFFYSCTYVHGSGIINNFWACECMRWTNDRPTSNLCLHGENLRTYVRLVRKYRYILLLNVIQGNREQNRISHRGLTLVLIRVKISGRTKIFVKTNHAIKIKSRVFFFSPLYE